MPPRPPGVLYPDTLLDGFFDLRREMPAFCFTAPGKRVSRPRRRACDTSRRHPPQRFRRRSQELLLRWSPCPSLIRRRRSSPWKTPGRSSPVSPIAGPGRRRVARSRASKPSLQLFISSSFAQGPSGLENDLHLFQLSDRQVFTSPSGGEKPGCSERSIPPGSDADS